ncbi:transposase [Paenarthrobacter sp. RAF54_2]|uniref:transposase n=1 Tax=Paenarthrobacter sp. RAF54_2 TaxID=3233061 RepID=UPI003F96D83E
MPAGHPDDHGVGLAVEIGDWTRFSGSSIGSYLGLVPSEESSGQSRHQGPITKAGNTYARKLLIEAAWQHRRPYARPGQRLMRQLDLVDPATRIRALEGNHRLHRKPGSRVGSAAAIAVAPRPGGTFGVRPR